MIFQSSHSAVDHQWKKNRFTVNVRPAKKNLHECIESSSGIMKADSSVDGVSSKTRRARDSRAFTRLTGGRAKGPIKIQWKAPLPLLDWGSNVKSSRISYIFKARFNCRYIEHLLKNSIGLILEWAFFNRGRFWIRMFLLLYITKF